MTNIHVLLCTSHLYPRPPRARDSGDSAGLKCQVLTSDESHGCAGDNSQLLFHIMSASGEPGLLAGILPQNLAPQCWAFNRALKIEKLKAPLIPGPMGSRRYK